MPESAGSNSAGKQEARERGVRHVGKERDAKGQGDVRIGLELEQVDELEQKAFDHVVLGAV